MTDPNQLAKSAPPSGSEAIEIARLRLAETMCRLNSNLLPGRVAEAFHKIVRAAHDPHAVIKYD